MATRDDIAFAKKHLERWASKQRLSASERSQLWSTFMRDPHYNFDSGKSWSQIREQSRSEGGETKMTRRPYSDPMLAAARALKKAESRGDMAVIEKAREQYHQVWAEQRMKPHPIGQPAEPQQVLPGMGVLTRPATEEEALAARTRETAARWGMTVEQHVDSLREQAQQLRSEAHTYAPNDPNRAEAEFSADNAERAVAAVERALHTGVRGGQYYMTASGEKQYVGRNAKHDAAQTRGRGPWQK